MFTLVAYDSSIAVGSALVDVKSLVDQHFTQSGDGYIVPRGLNKIIAAYGFGANLARVQLQSPTLRKLFQQELRPFDKAPAGAGARPNIVDFSNQIRTLGESEVLIAQVIQAGGVAENDIVGVWLADGPYKPIADGGEVISIKFSGTTTLTPAAWSLVVLTPDQTLVPGDYDIVGGRCKTATGVLFRIVINGFALRPGGVCVTTDTEADPKGQRFGGWGVWGTFNSTQIPNLEVLATAADTAEDLELDLIFKGGTPVVGAP